MGKGSRNPTAAAITSLSDTNIPYVINIVIRTASSLRECILRKVYYTRNRKEDNSMMLLTMNNSGVSLHHSHNRAE